MKESAHRQGIWNYSVTGANKRKHGNHEESHQETEYCKKKLIYA